MHLSRDVGHEGKPKVYSPGVDATSGVWNGAEMVATRFGGPSGLGVVPDSSVRCEEGILEDCGGAERQESMEMSWAVWQQASGESGGLSPVVVVEAESEICDSVTCWEVPRGTLGAFAVEVAGGDARGSSGGSSGGDPRGSSGGEPRGSSGEPREGSGGKPRGSSVEPRETMVAKKPREEDKGASPDKPGRAVRPLGLATCGIPLELSAGTALMARSKMA